MCKELIAVTICVVIYLLYTANTANTANTAAAATENYKSCLSGKCEGTLQMNTTSFINPFIWPYSASENINSFYSASPEERKYYGFGAGPLYNQTEPDNVVLTGGHY